MIRRIRGKPFVNSFIFGLLCDTIAFAFRMGAKVVVAECCGSPSLSQTRTPQAKSRPKSITHFVLWGQKKLTSFNLVLSSSFCFFFFGSYFLFLLLSSCISIELCSSITSSISLHHDLDQTPSVAFSETTNK